MGTETKYTPLYLESLRLNNIVLEANDVYPVGVNFQSYSANFTEEILGIEYHFRQIKDNEIVGSCTFEVNLYDTTITDLDSTQHKQANAISSSSTGEQSHSYRIFPNPVKDQCNLRVHGKTVSGAVVRIIDALGKELIRKDNVSIQPSEVYEINVSDLPNGVYFIEIRDNIGKLQWLRMSKVE